MKCSAAARAAAQKLGGHWVMAVYDSSREFGKNIGFYTSSTIGSASTQLISITAGSLDSRRRAAISCCST